jgi:hypothetical protein
MVIMPEKRGSTPDSISGMGKGDRAVPCYLIKNRETSFAHQGAGGLRSLALSRKSFPNQADNLLGEPRNWLVAF